MQRNLQPIFGIRIGNQLEKIGKSSHEVLWHYDFFHTCGQSSPYPDLGPNEISKIV